jgi:DNA-binding LacI/PurR family transcriptional regulator
MERQNAGVRQAIDHLVELGHRRIVHIDGGSEPGSPDRRRAYRAAMRRHKLDDEIRVVPGAHNEDAGIAAGQLFLSEDRLPTAVLAGNDRCAMGLLHALGRVGVDVPGDRRLDDNTIPPKEIVLDSKLVVRGTTARPPV